MCNPYQYEELRKAALKKPSPEALGALGEWLEKYGDDYWNGESWDIDEGKRLRPIYASEPDEYGTLKCLGYVIV